MIYKKYFEYSYVLIIFRLMMVAAKVENDTIQCGNSGKMLNDCFDDLSPDLVEFLTTTKIPVSRKEVTGKCTVFQQGMSCIDKYTEKCIESDRKKILDNNIFGAKTFLEALCNNRIFQEEYLKHKECFVFIQDDWQKCSARFITILSDELNVSGQHPKNASTRFMQFCCSRYAYERCIFNSAKFKCHKPSALFVRRVVRTLSMEKHFNNCGKFENLVCASTKTNKINVFVNIFVIINIFFYLKEFNFMFKVILS